MEKWNHQIRNFKKPENLNKNYGFLDSVRNHSLRIKIIGFLKKEWDKLTERQKAFIISGLKTHKINNLKELKSVVKEYKKRMKESGVLEELKRKKHEKIYYKKNKKEGSVSVAQKEGEKELIEEFLWRDPISFEKWKKGKSEASEEKKEKIMEIDFDDGIELDFGQEEYKNVEEQIYEEEKPKEVSLESQEIIDSLNQYSDNGDDHELDKNKKEYYYYYEDTLPQKVAKFGFKAIEYPVYPIFTWVPDKFKVNSIYRKIWKSDEQMFKESENYFVDKKTLNEVIEWSLDQEKGYQKFKSGVVEYANEFFEYRDKRSWIGEIYDKLKEKVYGDGVIEEERKRRIRGKFIEKVKNKYADKVFDGLKEIRAMNCWICHPRIEKFYFDNEEILWQQFNDSVNEYIDEELAKAKDKELKIKELKQEVIEWEIEAKKKFDKMKDRFYQKFAETYRKKYGKISKDELKKIFENLYQKMKNEYVKKKLEEVRKDYTWWKKEPYKRTFGKIFKWVGKNVLTPAAIGVTWLSAYTLNKATASIFGLFGGLWKSIFTIDEKNFATDTGSFKLFWEGAKAGWNKVPDVPGPVDISKAIWAVWMGDEKTFVESIFGVYLNEKDDKKEQDKK